MKPVEFPEQNVIFAKDQPEYLPLPAYKENGPQGQVISCWELTEDELEEIRRTGKIWLMTMTFNNPLQPILPAVFKSDVFITPPEEKRKVDWNYTGDINFNWRIKDIYERFNVAFWCLGEVFCDGSIKYDRTATVFIKERNAKNELCAVNFHIEPGSGDKEPRVKSFFERDDEFVQRIFEKSSNKITRDLNKVLEFFEK